MNKLCIFKSIYILLVFLVSLGHSQETIDLLCGDADCKRIVAEATAVMKYSSIDKNVLSFRPNDRIRIMARNVAGGPKLDLVLAEISGRRGWVPSRMIREIRVLIRTDQLIPTSLPSPFVKKENPEPKAADELTPNVEEEVPRVEETKGSPMSEPGIEENDSEENEDEDLAKMFRELSEEDLKNMLEKNVQEAAAVREVVVENDSNDTLTTTSETAQQVMPELLISNITETANETENIVPELPSPVSVPLETTVAPEVAPEVTTPAPNVVPSFQSMTVPMTTAAAVELKPETPPMNVEEAAVPLNETDNLISTPVPASVQVPEPVIFEKVSDSTPQLNETEEIPKETDATQTTESIAATTPAPQTPEAPLIVEVVPDVTPEPIPQLNVSDQEPKQSETVEESIPVTTPIPIEVVPPPLPLEKLVAEPQVLPEVTTTPPVTTTVPDFRELPPSRDYIDIERTTTPLPKVEEVTTATPLPKVEEETTTSPLPKVEEVTTTTPPIAKGVGSFVELTGTPAPSQPEITTTPPALEETPPTTNEDPLETESFFSGIWNKVTGLFNGSNDIETVEIETTTQSSFDDDLHKILFSDGKEENKEATIKDEAFCARFTTDPECAKLQQEPVQERHKPLAGGMKHPLVSNQQHHHHHHHEEEKPNTIHNHHEEEKPKTIHSIPLIGPDTDYIQVVFEELIQMIDLIITLALTALVVLIFALGYYCINKSRREAPLLAKINGLERHLMASFKENTMLKSEMQDTRHKLASIEDNSFGSNDMVIALRKDLDTAEQINQELQDQVESLEKELENAAEAGLELNKMVSELLSNQTGSDSIISSVEELQRQLNEQQETIISMNQALAVKSRENSELQILIGEQTSKLNQHLEELQADYDNLKLEKTQIEMQLNIAQQTRNEQMREIMDVKGREIQKLANEVEMYRRKFEEANAAQRLSATKVYALETCVQEMKKGASGEIGELMDVAELKADLLAVTKEKDILKETLDSEQDSRRLLEDRVRVVNDEVSQLKKDYTKAEQEKSATETRLEILSTYFKEKEAQLQQELSVKEAKWLQKQGETTSTVERVRAMQNEIQSLKSQNDSLRAEIEAQSTANKLQNVTLENRAHDAWLNSRQTERKLEEARSEASALRRKLTSMAEVPGGGGGLTTSALDSMMPNDMPSPIRVESPNHPNVVPPPMMMPSFMPPPPFGLPGLPPPGMPPFIPPPFMPGGDLRSGRLMSPPPPNNRYSPNMHGRDRDYSPERSRQYSPTDSRYNYSAMSPYETETDFSPPPSPPRQNYGRDNRDYRDGPRSSGQFGNTGNKKAYSPPPTKSSTNRSSKTKGALSSGSQDSVGPRKGGK